MPNLKKIKKNYAPGGRMSTKKGAENLLKGAAKAEEIVGFMSGVKKAKNYTEFKKMFPDVDITKEGFMSLKSNSEWPNMEEDTAGEVYGAYHKEGKRGGGKIKKNYSKGGGVRPASY